MLGKGRNVPKRPSPEFHTAKQNSNHLIKSGVIFAKSYHFSRSLATPVFRNHLIADATRHRSCKKLLRCVRSGDRSLTGKAKGEAKI